jgi:glycosyltransferase involved in cell wall biosynthesis
VRIVFVVHGHPKYSKGGAEVACYNLFKAAVSQGHDAFLVAGSTSAEATTDSPIDQLADNEFIIAGQTPDYFFLQSGNSAATEAFEKLLSELRPDVIHFHHFIHLGLDWLPLAKATVPNAQLILTLHEFYAICANNGQMVEQETHNLCDTANPAKCGVCMGRPSDQMLFRELMFKGAFSRVDHFVSPSQFLVERYVDWGLDREQITVIENGLDLSLYQHRAQSREKPLKNGCLNLAYFGQLTPFKGVDILLDALLYLPADTLAGIKLRIHGANLSIQRDDYKAALSDKIARLGNVVELCGRYESEEFSGLVALADYMVMPSRWWENSPVVIQEARACQVPIIVSDIGGMREKVVPGINGLWFEAGNAVSLAALLEELLVSVGQRGFQITTPLSHTDSFLQHLPVYQST